MVLESLDGQVLLTRRAASLRAFPGVWVPPGGYVDAGETLEEAGLRELREETGLALATEECGRVRKLGIWESVYPASLAHGLPKRHCIVLYLLLRHASASAATLASRLRLSPAEVDLAVWLSSPQVRAIVHGETGSEDQVAAWTSAGERTQHPLRLLLQRLSIDAVQAVEPGGREDSPLERVSTGTRFALREWLQKYAD